MYPNFYLNMKSALMLDGQSSQKSILQEHTHVSTPSLPRELTLEDISPKWALRLKNMPTFMSPTWFQWRYQLQKASKCVVGEAYGYSSHYAENCNKCNKIGCKFLYYFMLNRRKKLEQNKQQFVKHWHEQHIQNERPFLPNTCSVHYPSVV